MIHNASCLSAHICGFLSDDEVNKLRGEANDVDYKRHESSVDGLTARRSGLAKLESAFAMSIRDRIRRVAAQANAEWGLEIDGPSEPWLYLCRYGEGDQFQWHRDWAPGRPTVSRWKIGASLQLSPHDAYNGGEFEFFTGSEKCPVWTAPRDAGALTLFIAHAFHRVAPITAGCRLAAVMFVAGLHPLK